MTPETDQRFLMIQMLRNLNLNILKAPRNVVDWIYKRQKSQI